MSAAVACTLFSLIICVNNALVTNNITAAQHQAATAELIRLRREAKA